jgi:hypothetical protein
VSNSTRPIEPPDHSGETATPQGLQPSVTAGLAGGWPVAKSFALNPDPEQAPAPTPGDQAWQDFQAERAERIIVLGRIRAQLEAQPNARAIRASVRRWNGFIRVMGEAVVAEREAEAS